MCQQKIPSQPNEKRTIGVLVADDAPLHTQQRERFEYFGLILVFRFCLLLCVFYFVFQQMLHQLLMLIQKAMHMRIMYKTRAEN